MKDEQQPDMSVLAEDREIDPVLAGRADAAIRAGLAAGKERKRGRRRTASRRIHAASAACLLLLVCLVTIRVSPAFASAVRQIPGMASLVDAIRQEYPNDQSILDAVDNDYMQKVGLSDEHGGLKFTVEGIVADEFRMNLLYSIQGLRPDEQVELHDLSLTDGTDRQLQLGYGSSGNVTGQADGAKKMENISVLFSKEEPLPDKLGVVLTLRGQKYKVAFAVDTGKFAGHSRSVPMDYTLEAAGQKIIFERAVISPLTIKIEARFAKSNTMKIFGGGDMKLVDDTGKEWSVPSMSSGTNDPDRTLFTFQSSYFRKPQALYLTGTWLRALDKDKNEIVIDTEKGLLLKAPDDKVTLLESTESGGELQLRFNLDTGRKDDNMSYNLLDGSFMDGSGSWHEGKLLGSSASANSDETNQTLAFKYTAGAYKQPLTFPIGNYPNYIERRYRIPISLSGVWDQD